MLLVKGTFQNGVIHLNEPVDWEDGQPVVITLGQADNDNPKTMDDWEKLRRLIQECAVDTGIGDLARLY